VTGTPFRNYTGTAVDLSWIGQGGSCFIVLAGPSVRECDLSLLSRRGCYSIAVNNSATLFRPHFWTHTDPPYRFHDSIWRDSGVIKCVPQNHIDRYYLRHAAAGELAWTTLMPKDCPGVVGYERNAWFAPERWLTEESINWGNSYPNSKKNRQPHAKSVLFAAIKQAWCLGFRTVYLVGADFRMEAANPYGFSETRDDGQVEANNRLFGKLDEMLSGLYPVFMQSGFHVFNCCKNSGLTAFPHCSYASAVNVASGSLQQGELDASGWYNR